MEPTQVFLQITAITAPVFAMVFLGFGLKRIHLLNDSFIGVASNLIFKATMPTLFFLSISKANLSEAIQLDLLLYITVGTLFAFFASWWWAVRTLQPVQRSAFVQGSFRGNCGVVSYALVVSFFGEWGMSVGGVLAGYVIVLFNALAVFILAFYSPTFTFSPKNMAKELARNPLIVSVVLGLLAAAVHLRLPMWLETSASYFAQMTLPLALICIGGTLSVAGLKSSGWPSLQSAFIKLALAPVLGCALAWALGLDGRSLVVLWLFLSSPTAVASFAMALAAKGDGKLAANIIAVTTLFSMFTVTFGTWVLRVAGH
ncbi:MAG: AEC family transporter [Limnobacter sp.]|nr:AEC family transporter [Limnobacter sp.]